MLKITKNKKLVLNALFFILVLIISSIFRITNIDLIEFKSDEAVNLLLAARPVFGHPFPPGGTVSSLGVLNPPFFTYILFPLTIFTLDPKQITLAIAFLNSLAIGFFYLIIKKYYGQITALCSSILFALSPWAIIFSRKIWTQDLLIPFFIPFFYSIHKIVIDKKLKFFFLYGLSSMLLIQLHQASIIFITIITGLILFKKQEVDWKYFFLGIFIGLLPLFPLIFYEIKNGCPDCLSFFEARKRLNSFYDLAIFARPFQIVGFGNLHFLIGNDIAIINQKFQFLDFIRKFLYIEYLLLPFGFILYTFRFKKLNILAFSLLLTSLAYFLLKIEPFIHYYIITIPLLFLFLGTIFSYLFINKKLVIRLFGYLLFLFVIIGSISSNVIFLNLLKEKGSLSGNFGTAYVLSEKEVKKRLIEFEKRPDYNEIFLSSYIPLDYIFGYLPMGKILYSDISQEDILKLENELKNDSKDPRVKQKILSFYSQSHPTIEQLDTLKKKKNDFSEYDFAYQIVRSDYMSKNFKKEFISSILGVSFFYPEHWKATEYPSEVILEEDKYLLAVRKNKNGIKIFCIKGACNVGNIKQIEESIRPL